MSEGISSGSTRMDVALLHSWEILESFLMEMNSPSGSVQLFFPSFTLFDKSRSSASNQGNKLQTLLRATEQDIYTKRTLCSAKLICKRFMLPLQQESSRYQTSKSRQRRTERRFASTSLAPWIKRIHFPPSLITVDGLLSRSIPAHIFLKSLVLQKAGNKYPTLSKYGWAISIVKCAPLHRLSKK